MRVRRSLSSTGIWRKLPFVMRSITLVIESFTSQVETFRVITCATGSCRTVLPTFAPADHLFRPLGGAGAPPRARSSDGRQHYREKNSLTRYRVPANRARSSFGRTYVTSPFPGELMANLIPGPALMVRREASDVSVSGIGLPRSS
jgi:hypothetical protein